MNPKEQALADVAEAFAREGIVWAVGASYLLYVHGLAQDFHDFDLLVDLRDAPRADAILASMGERAEAKPSGDFATAHFASFAVDDVDFDLLGGFAIRTEDGVYRYPFGASRVVGSVRVQGVEVPLSALEDWLVLYRLMGRDAKADLLHEHLCEHGEIDRFDGLLTDALPDDLRREVREIVSALRMGG